jgi:hypothetical protein
MKKRDFSKAAKKRLNCALLPLVLALSACGGGGGGETLANDVAPTALTAEAQMFKQKTRTEATTTTATPTPTSTSTSTSTATTTPTTTTAAAAASSTTNLVSNPGFENGLTGWGNWGNSVATTGQADSGLYALSVGIAAGGVGQNIAGVTAGTSYRFTGQAKLSVAGETVYLGVKFLDAAGATLLEKNAPVTSTAYSTVTLDAVAPANSTAALVYVWKNAGSGVAYVDTVTLASVSTTTTATATPTPAPAPTTTTTTTAPAPTTTTTAPAPAPAPTTTAPSSTSPIPIAAWPNTLLQTGFNTDAYWIEDNSWGAAGLTRGTYTGITGSTYEQYTGVSPNMGPNGEVSFRWAWKYPTGTTEVKAYPSVISGRKPGYYNTWTNPAGEAVRLLDGTQSATYPSGATPGTIFPLQLPLASLKASFNYNHLSAPTGHGHLSYDIWLQGTPTQVAGFSAPPISHEIMIPLNNWGGYGQYPTGRNPGWYDHDVTLDGRVFHVYVNKGSDGSVRANFGGGWKFIVFQPDGAIPPGTLNLATFINYVATRKDAFGTPWANGSEYAVSVELGVEPVDGVGDLQISNYRVWK